MAPPCRSRRGSRSASPAPRARSRWGAALVRNVALPEATGGRSRDEPLLATGGAEIHGTTPEGIAVSLGRVGAILRSPLYDREVDAVAAVDGTVRLERLPVGDLEVTL